MSVGVSVRQLPVAAETDWRCNSFSEGRVICFMRTNATTLVIASLLCCVSAISGCSNRLPVPKVVPVRVQVLAGSKPAAGAIVTLFPDDSSLRRPKGIAASDGYVSLTTIETGDGAPPGVYKVTVEWPEAAGRLSQKQLTEAVSSGDTLKDRFNGRFADPEMTPFELTIEPDSSDLPPINLPG